MTAVLSTSAATATPQRRRVNLDFSTSAACWNRRHEQFGYLVNAISTLLPHLERFLVDTVEQARPLVTDPGLLGEMADFCYQERRHNANHVKFNRMVAAAGYDAELAAAVPRLDPYYAALARRGHRFGLAWSEGFETVAPFVAVFMFEHAEEFGLTDWDDPATALWLWHMSEEFEHRTVCNEAYAAAYGHYLTRVRGLWSATWHLFAYSVPLAWTMAANDWSSLPPRTRRRRQIRFAAMVARLAGSVGPRLVGRAMRPRYDPSRLRPPAGMQDLLDHIATRHGTVLSSSDQIAPL